MKLRTFQPGNLRDQLFQLFPLTQTHIQKSNSDIVRVVDRLDHAAQQERQTFEMKLRLYAVVDAHRKSLIATDPAGAHAQVNDVPVQL